MVHDHLPTYGSVTATAAAVGPQLGISENTLRRWVNQADVDAGRREGVPTDVQAELARLTAENKRLHETNEILRRALDLLRGGTRPPRPLICAFIDTLVGDGFAFKSVCAILTTEGCQVAARTYRSWKQNGRHVADRVRDDGSSSTHCWTPGAPRRALWAAEDDRAPARDRHAPAAAGPGRGLAPPGRPTHGRPGAAGCGRKPVPTGAGAGVQHFGLERSGRAICHGPLTRRRDCRGADLRQVPS